MKRIDALILYAADLMKTVEFYKALGLPLEPEQHDDGPIHYTHDLNAAHIAIYQGKPGRSLERGTSGSCMYGFQVESVEKCLAIAKGMSAKILIGPQEVEWGVRIIVEDPDGRSVELNQAK